MKLIHFSLGFALAVIASAFAFDGTPHRGELELPAFGPVDPSPAAAASVVVLEPIASGGRTVASLESANGSDSGAKQLDAAWWGRPTQKAWDWQFGWAADRCIADPELNPACKTFDERGRERLDALLLELNLDVRQAQDAFRVEVCACKQRKIDAGKFDLVPKGERIRSDPRALCNSFLPLADGRTRHVQLFQFEFRSLDEALATRDESRDLRRARVRKWIREW